MATLRGKAMLGAWHLNNSPDEGGPVGLIPERIRMLGLYRFTGLRQFANPLITLGPSFELLMRLWGP